jgi:pimeloyl-ACP methyl ester carboxylesterase
MAVQRPSSVGAIERAPFVSKPQGSQQQEMQHRDATRGAKYQSRAPTPRRNDRGLRCDMAKAITVPALLSNGERSQRFLFRITDQLVACWPNSERIVVTQSSHAVPSENPGAYDQAVLTFLAMH